MNGVVSQNIRDAMAMLQQLAGLEPQMEAATTTIADALISGQKLLACGNGGSAADASHLTTEFVCRFDKDRRPYPAISLAVHGGDLTAIGNDYSFHDLFARQVQAFGRQGDVLAVFTTSGNSENVRKALVAANDLKMKTIAFLGRDGGRCLGLAGIELLVSSNVTARIQEGHKFLLHTICEMVEERLPG
jgi:D-sedoheptulose 7-phosphate isomerase